MNKIDEYYSKRGYVSNSMLGTLSKSPAYFLYKQNTNSEEKDSKSLEKGKLLHLYIESPEDFIVSDVVKPPGMMGDYIDKLHEVGEAENRLQWAYDHSGFKQSIELVQKNFEKPENQAYYEFLKESSDKQCLTKDQKNIVDNCVQALQLNPLIQGLLFNYESSAVETYQEYCIYFEYPIKKDWIGQPEQIGKSVQSKGRLDKLIIDHERKLIIINDLKTTSENPYGEFTKINKSGILQVDFRGTGWFNSYIKYRYDRQAYFYIAAVMRSLMLDKYKDYKVSFNFIVVETRQPYDSCVYTINLDALDHSLDYAKRDTEILLQKYLWHLEAGDWRQPYDFREIVEI